MSVTYKHLLSQGSVISGMGSLLVNAFQENSSDVVALPGPVLEEEVSPRPKKLVKDYIRAVGGDPSSYHGMIPHHMFPQWGFGVAARTLKPLPYPLAKVVNGGCSIEVKKPIPATEKMVVTAQLMSVDDNGRRVLIDQKIVTKSASGEELMVAHLYPVIPLKKKGAKSAPKPKPSVPLHMREISFQKIRANAGLDFAKLTGDINPIHWIPAYARMSGFKNTILHGFCTMARAMEAIRRHRVPPGQFISNFEVEFRRPLVLPAKVGIYVDAAGEICVGDALGGPAYMEGRYQLRTQKE